MQITLNIQVAPELIDAIKSLATALSGNKLEPVKVAPVANPFGDSQYVTPQTPVVNPVANPVDSSNVVPYPVQVATPVAAPPAPVPTTSAAPVPPAAPTGAAVPTTAQTFSMEQLAVAATQLVDAGRRNELVSLLASFGVQALTALPKEQYGAFATQLRAMGAKI